MIGVNIIFFDVVAVLNAVVAAALAVLAYRKVATHWNAWRHADKGDGLYLSLVSGNMGGIAHARRHLEFTPRTGSPASSTPVTFQEVNLGRKRIAELLYTIEFNERVLLVGPPGSGKTSLLRYLASWLAGADRPIEGLRDVRIPILVSLSKIHSNSLTAQTLSMYCVPEDIRQLLPEDFFTRHLAKGDCLVLFDGLDEVRSDELRRQVSQDIQDLAIAYPRNRFVLSSRPDAWRAVTLDGFAVVRMERPTTAEILQRVYEVYAREETSDILVTGEAQETAAKVGAFRIATDLVQLLVKNEELMQLVADPFWLNLVAHLFRSRAYVPRKRIQVLEAACDDFLSYWDKARRVADQLPVSKKVQLLGSLAYWLEKNRRTWAGPAEITQVLAQTPEGGMDIEVSEFLRTVSNRSGLLRELGPNMYGFSHFIFQEYLTARYLADSVTGRDTILNHMNDPLWNAIRDFYQEMSGSGANGGGVTP